MFQVQIDIDQFRKVTRLPLSCLDLTVSLCCRDSSAPRDRMGREVSTQPSVYNVWAAWNVAENPDAVCGAARADHPHAILWRRTLLIVQGRECCKRAKRAQLERNWNIAFCLPYRGFQTLAMALEFRAEQTIPQSRREAVRGFARARASRWILLQMWRVPGPQLNEFQRSAR
jgi:hypothetical protein